MTTAQAADTHCVDWTARAEFEVDLASIKCPTVVMHGDADPYAAAPSPARSARWSAAAA